MSDCGHVPALPDADPTICWKCGKVITAEAGRPWRLVTAAEIPVTYFPNPFGYWVILNARQQDLAWSGARWVPHENGLAEIGPNSVQVCSFPTIEEARAYADERFPEESHGTE